MGGVDVDEPSADLGIAIAMQPVPEMLLLIHKPL